MYGTSDFESPGYYFFVLGKTYNGAFLGIFRGALDLFDPKIALSCTQDNLGVKKVSAPLKCLTVCFAYEKKNDPRLSKSAVHEWLF
jgi:hypothetical protein